MEKEFPKMKKYGKANIFRKLSKKLHKSLTPKKGYRVIGTTKLYAKQLKRMGLTK